MPPVDRDGQVAAGPSTDDVQPSPDFPVLSDSDRQALRVFRQGDVLEELTTMVVGASTGGPRALDAPDGVVIISQTCDVVLPNRPTVQLARRARLSGRAAEGARDGKQPRYVHLPTAGAGDFADLEVISTVEKVLLVNRKRVPGVETDDEIRRFGGAVARRFGRFPFPDDVSPWLRPLEEVVSSRARNPGSPEEPVLNQVVELRVEATNGWQAPPYDLTLIVIVEPGTLPMFPDDDVPDRSTALTVWLYKGTSVLQQNSSDIAGRLTAATTPEERYWLWTALGEAWAARCTPKGTASTSVREAVTTIVGEVVSADEFPLTRVRRSEQLDLDHLSAPAPQ